MPYPFKITPWHEKDIKTAKVMNELAKYDWEHGGREYFIKYILSGAGQKYIEHVAKKIL